VRDWAERGAGPTRDEKCWRSVSGRLRSRCVMYTRREFGTMALAGLSVPRFLDAATSALVNGVRLGVQTYSFRDMPRTPGSDMVDPRIKEMLDGDSLAGVQSA